MSSSSRRTPPSRRTGCRVCGIGPRVHLRRWAEGIGWHSYVPPTDRPQGSRSTTSQTDEGKRRGAQNP